MSRSIEALDALEVAEAKVQELTDQLAEATKERDKARIATAPFAIGDEVEMLTIDAGWAPAEVTFIRLAYSTKHGPDWFFDYDTKYLALVTNGTEGVDWRWER
jgi:hypothetical protein